MQITIDTKHDDTATLRLAASFILALTGDISAETDPQTATGEQLDKLLSGPRPAGMTDAEARSSLLECAAPPPPPPPPPPAVTPTSTASPAGSVPPPPPVSSANTADMSTTTVAQAATTAAGASTAASAERVYDSAGLPWDARIHQKKQGRKQDGTWKLIKGIDPNIVTAVVRELQATKLPASVTGAAPPVPTGTATAAPPVPLPPPGPAVGSVPVPPVPPAVPTAIAELPAPGAVPGASVPVPPTPAPGGVPASGITYKQLIDKTITATKDNRLSAQKVNEIVQSCGAPSLMALAGMPNLFDEVNTKLELALAGLA